MSLVTATLVSLIFICLSCITVNGLEAAINGDVPDPTWNYDDHGEDWTMGNCGNRATGAFQSPLGDISTAGTGLKPWTSYDSVSFLTAWQEATLKTGDYGFSNYTYRVNATDGNMGVLYATEPYYAKAQVVWTVEQLRFKYPPEHTFDGETYDMEMQIHLNDTLDRCKYCFAHQGALSLFFNIGTETGDFWNWLDATDKKINLEDVFTKTSFMES